MISIINRIDSKVVSLDMEKVSRHPVQPGDLEVRLDSVRGKFFATAHIGNYDNSVRTGNIMAFKDETQARDVFPKIVAAVERGDYSVDIYDNGEVQVSIKY